MASGEQKMTAWIYEQPALPAPPVRPERKLEPGPPEPEQDNPRVIIIPMWENPEEEKSS